MVFDELAYYFGLAEHLGQMQHQVRRSDSFRKAAGHVHAHDVGGQEVDGLA